MEYYLLNYNKKRPNNSIPKLKKELINYLKEESKKKHFPSRRELERKFHTQLYESIYSLYNSAGLKYKLCANQDLKTIKANLLLRLMIKNLGKLNLELSQYRKIHENGIDIIAKKNDKKIGIELKAYNKYEKLKQRNIKQVERFIKNEQLDNAIIITTTDLKDGNLKILENIKIIWHKDLIKILTEKEQKSLIFIREKSVNFEDVSKNIKRQKILDYVYKRFNEDGVKPGYAEISKKLHLDVYTYFENLFEIYKVLRIPPPLKNMNGKGAKSPDIDCINLWKEEFKRYILEELEKGNKYPSGVEIGEYFGISHIWNIIKVSDLYKELNLKPYLEREKRAT